MPPVITARGLARRFGARDALRGLDLDVRPGRVSGLLGHNGAGKTTTVRLLNGVLTPTAGDATVLGLTPHLDGPALRKRTGVLTETPALDERLTGRENLAAFAALHDLPRTETAHRVRERLEDLGLADVADERVATYSKGMRQRLALARTLLHDPELLFFDEPTSGLDPVSANAVHELIERLVRRENRTVVLCTHNLAEAERLCDEIAVIRHGRVVAAGTPAELVNGSARGTVEVEVDPRDVARARAALHARGDGEVDVDGARLRVRGLAHADVPTLVAALVRADVAVHRVQPAEGSLREFYLRLEGEARPA